MTESPSTHAAGSGYETERPLLSHRQIQVVFTGLMLGMLLAALDQTIVSTALPTIVGELGDQNKLAWVITSYLLASTVSTPLWGKISDLYGRKHLFQAAIVVFMVGSMLIGLSQNMVMLIAFRAVQGLGAGGLMALAQAIIADIVAPRERGRYQGYIGSVFAFSSVVGPVLGGFFVDNLSWRWAFYINVPVGIVALVVTSAVLRLPVRRVEHRIDYLGAALLVAGVSPLLIAAEWGGREYPWGSSMIIGLAGGGLVGIAAFLWQERRATEPILPLRLFSNATISIACSALFVVGLAMFGAIVFVPQYLQVVTGASPTTSGMFMLPLMMGLMGTVITSGRIIAKTGRYKRFPVIGLTTVAVGMYLLSFLDVGTSRAYQSFAMFVLGAGIGMVMQVLVLVVQNSVEMRDLGVATSTATFARSMGGAMGVAVFGSIMNNRLHYHIPRLLAGGEGATSSGEGRGVEAMSSLLRSPKEIRALPEPIRGAVLEGFARSLHVVFLAAIPVALLGLVIVLFLKEVELHSAKGHGDKGADAVGQDLLAGLEATVDQDHDAMPDLIDNFDIPEAAGPGERGRSGRSG